MPTTTAWLSPSSAVSQSIGSSQIGWSFATSGGDATGVSSENDAGASITMQYSLPTSCQHILARGFDFSSIPSNSTITAIEVRIRRKAETASTIKDFDLRLIQDPTPTFVGSSQADTANWHSTTYAYTSYGGSDTWGATLSVADVQDSNFGVGYKVQCSPNPSTAKGAWTDVIQMRITYVENGAALAGESALVTDGYSGLTAAVEVPEALDELLVTSEMLALGAHAIVPLAETASQVSTGGSASMRASVRVPVAIDELLETDGDASLSAGAAVALTDSSSINTGGSSAMQAGVSVSFSLTSVTATSESISMSVGGATGRRRVILFT